jgi:hypothetical protein
MTTHETSPVETRPEVDQLQRPDPVPAEYSENLIMMGYDPASEHSFYWHWSRMHADPDLWEGLIAIYRPGGELLVERHFGKHGNNVDVADSGHCSFTVEAPLQRWHARFEGSAARANTVEAARDLVADSGEVSLRADLVFEGISPVFSAGAAMDNQDWGDGHLEQAGRVTGTIVIEGDEITLDCSTAFRDHTWGRRNYEGLDRHAWCYGIFPSGRIFLVLEAWHDPDEHACFGFVVEDGTMVLARPVQTPDLKDPAGEPRRFTIALESSVGDMTVNVEMLHAMSFHLKAPLEMPLGTDWGAERNTINVEGPTVCDWNGERGYGWIERTNRVGRLTKP